jgi:hypothetical protein
MSGAEQQDDVVPSWRLSPHLPHAEEKRLERGRLRSRGQRQVAWQDANRVVRGGCQTAKTGKPGSTQQDQLRRRQWRRLGRPRQREKAPGLDIINVGERSSRGNAEFNANPPPFRLRGREVAGRSIVPATYNIKQRPDVSIPNKSITPSSGPRKCFLELAKCFHLMFVVGQKARHQNVLLQCVPDVKGSVAVSVLRKVPRTP